VCALCNLKYTFPFDLTHMKFYKSSLIHLNNTFSRVAKPQTLMKFFTLEVKEINLRYGATSNHCLRACLETLKGYKFISSGSRNQKKCFVLCLNNKIVGK